MVEQMNVDMETKELLSSCASEKSSNYQDELLAEDLLRLRKMQETHPFWQNRFFRACSEGSLTKDDFRFIFSQYYHYSRNFTRYIAAVMANCDNDLFRSRLSENLWEESGGLEPEKRHAQLFRNFLQKGLGISIEEIKFADCADNFVNQYLRYCFRSDIVSASAFISLGTEGIVSRMYSIMIKALRGVGVNEEHLEFFQLHINCDDAHALTLEEMMISYRNQPNWFNTCAVALDYALTLRQQFFESLMDLLPVERIKSLIKKAQGHVSLVDNTTTKADLSYQSNSEGAPLYHNIDEKNNIHFNVVRIPIKSEILDPRIVHIPANKSNEHHRHSHETLMYIIKGEGYVCVDDFKIEVKEGDTVFVPRWAVHQATNSGSSEMVYLAVTDFGFAQKVFLGDYLAGHRGKKENDHSFEK